MGNVFSHLAPTLVVNILQVVYVCGRWWEVQPSCETVAEGVGEDIEVAVDGFAIAASVMTGISWVFLFFTAWAGHRNREVKIRRFHEGVETRMRQSRTNVECVKLRNDVYQHQVAARAKEREHQAVVEEVKT